ncbi:MAG: DinB family protein [Bacteroidia bacterium]|nr:DinB family protein [Bacteroidia bacterium]
MNIKEAFLNEFNHEAAITRKFIERVPYDKLDFKPHPKSMPMGSLTNHIVEIVSYWQQVLENKELNFANKNTFETNTSENLLKSYDQFVEEAQKAIQNYDENQYSNLCEAKAGDKVFFTMPIYNICRTIILNHWIHHRAQLGTYLRQLDLPVPGAYGPSADEV